jgi:uncharacterized protein with von Willebrand factor type A (vWA) domain
MPPINHHWPFEDIEYTSMDLFYELFARAAVVYDNATYANIATMLAGSMKGHGTSTIELLWPVVD